MAVRFWKFSIDVNKKHLYRRPIHLQKNLFIDRRVKVGEEIFKDIGFGKQLINYVKGKHWK